jgi:hypothetical protein
MMRLDDLIARLAPEYRRFSDVRLALSPSVLILAGFYGDASWEPASPFENILDDYASANRFAAVDLGNFMGRPMVLYIPAACRAAV